MIRNRIPDEDPLEVDTIDLLLYTKIESKILPSNTLKWILDKRFVTGFLETPKPKPGECGRKTRSQRNILIVYLSYWSKILR